MCIKCAMSKKNFLGVNPPTPLKGEEREKGRVRKGGMEEREGRREGRKGRDEGKGKN